MSAMRGALERLADGDYLQQDHAEQLARLVSVLVLHGPVDRQEDSEPHCGACLVIAPCPTTSVLLHGGRA